MRTLWQLVAFFVAAALAACSVKPITYTPDDGQRAEDCSVPGDEDGNGLADCRALTKAMEHGGDLVLAADRAPTSGTPFVISLPVRGLSQL